MPRIIVPVTKVEKLNEYRVYPHFAQAPYFAVIDVLTKDNYKVSIVQNPIRFEPSYGFGGMGRGMGKMEEVEYTMIVDGEPRILKPFGKIETELYNLRKDPKQQYNVLEDNKDIAKELGWAKDRDEMRKLPLEKQKELQIKTAERVAEMKNVIVDTHCTVKTPQGYMPGLPEWVIKRLNPRTIVIVEADPEEIYRRRQKDKTRKRDPDTIEEINEHQQMNRAIAMAYAALSGATVKIVFNHDNAIDEAVEQAKPVLQD